MPYVIPATAIPPNAIGLDATKKIPVAALPIAPDAAVPNTPGRAVETPVITA